MSPFWRPCLGACYLSDRRCRFRVWASKAERVEWFLATVYCTCGVGKDVCTGDFYTLASCNPNGCGRPNHVRNLVAAMIDKGWSDRQIIDELLKQAGPLLLRPHLRP